MTALQRVPLPGSPLSINFLVFCHPLRIVVLMPVARNGLAASERRRERRHASSALEIVIGDERFRAINWSMRGALLYGICELVGARIRGEMGIPGSSDPIPFAATVVRADLDTGNSAICFEDCRTDRIDFHGRVAAMLQ